MSIPSHDATCSTKTWPSTCPDCTKSVFFLSCSCGSKVFFDDLGDPWPLHYVNCLGHKVRVLRNADGLSIDEVERRIDVEAQRLGTPVPGTVRKLLRTLTFRETGAPTLLVLTPGGDERDYVGTIADTMSVNFFKRFNVDPSKPLAKGLLGKLVQEEHVELYLRGPINKVTGFVTRVDAYVTKGLYDRACVSRGQRVIVRIAPRTFGSERFWVVKELLPADQ